MKKTPISVTDAARNFADCVNRVYYQNMTFVLLKNGSPVAQLAPVPKNVSAGPNLAQALAKVKLSPEEARAWNRDLRNVCKALKAPRNRWR